MNMSFIIGWNYLAFLFSNSSLMQAKWPSKILNFTKFVNSLSLNTKIGNKFENICSIDKCVLCIDILLNETLLAKTDIYDSLDGNPIDIFIQKNSIILGGIFHLKIKTEKVEIL